MPVRVLLVAAVLARGAVWGAGAAVLALLSIVTALGMGAVAVRDPHAGGPALGALVLTAAGIAWGRAARHGLRRTAGRSGTA